MGVLFENNEIHNFQKKNYEKLFHPENVAVDSQQYVRSQPTFIESLFMKQVKNSCQNIRNSFNVQLHRPQK